MMWFVAEIKIHFEKSLKINFWDFSGNFYKNLSHDLAIQTRKWLDLNRNSHSPSFDIFTCNEMNWVLVRPSFTISNPLSSSHLLCLSYLSCEFTLSRFLPTASRLMMTSTTVMPLIQYNTREQTAERANIWRGRKSNLVSKLHLISTSSSFTEFQVVNRTYMFSFPHVYRK